MTSRVGATVVDVLQQAGERYLRPDIYPVFLLHLGGTKTVYLYDDTEAYWHRIQIILDAFFTSRQRADITGALIEQDDLRTRPAFQPFLSDALAERRLQGFFVTEIPADAGEGD